MNASAPMNPYTSKRSKRMRARHVYCGVDEAGRGALAGPVVAAAVACAPCCVDGLKDSKQLSDRQRRVLRHLIYARCDAYAVGMATVEEIDRHNIRVATAMAMKRAVQQIPAHITHVLVDGDFVPDVERKMRAIIRGDSMHGEIMAASILAKTTRDDILIALDKTYPKYNFARHKGYATEEHRQALKRHGICKAHRLSFAPVKQLHAAHH